ncbi:uncharacterized protein G2W53_009148 [Senna tora]|uniref:Uncharacterized protein n=1 Tax=Senna tora TaxID=362788 RepID=A0A834WY07_9FABA|nr:uncharacterized protein G2W53_009148 [Senna tora]
MALTKSEKKKIKLLGYSRAVSRVTSSQVATADVFHTP